MYQGSPTGGMKFYELLMESEEFTSALGKVTLASGKLEAELIILLTKNGVKGDYNKATLGKLISIGIKNNLFDQNMIISLQQISKQRNYITHNIYALFTDLIDETILERNNLLDSDVYLYVERAWQLQENLDGVAEILKQKNRNC
ncbi:hypothetical protein JYB64_20705 [Algoriphagus aestuarii]|nr:hypothetical protein [Algoriphagus aestuarii]